MVSGGGGNKHDKPGRARQVPPEMDMNLELMLKYWFLLSNLHMVAAGLIFGRPSNFHKIWNASKTLAICCYFEGVVGTVVAAMATEGCRDGVGQPASSRPESQRRSRQEAGDKKIMRFARKSHMFFCDREKL